MRTSKQLLFEIDTDSKNELLDGRVGKQLKDVRRHTTFIRDILVLAEHLRLFFSIMVSNILGNNAVSSIIV